MNYPSDFHNKIIFGDCLDIMPHIPDSSVDMILCDLPYAITSRNSWDSIIPFDKLWDQYKRICKAGAVIALTAAQPFSSELVMSNRDMFKYEIIWVKNKSSGFLNAKKMPLRKHESILIFYSSKTVYNPQKTHGHKPASRFTQNTGCGTNYGKTIKGFSGGGQTDRYPTSVLDFDVVNNISNSRVHPTQKPVPLFENLIKTYTNAGMIVLDNCIGSGTTAIAARNTGRIFIGIEKEKEYYDIASKRLNDNQLDLFHNEKQKM